MTDMLTSEEVYEELLNPRFTQKTPLEFFNVGGVYQLMDIKTEEFIRQHEAFHESMRHHDMG